MEHLAHKWETFLGKALSCGVGPQRVVEYLNKRVADSRSKKVSRSVSFVSFHSWRQHYERRPHIRSS